MIHSHMSMRPVRDPGDDGWVVACKLQPAKRCIDVSISQLLTGQPHTYKHTASYAQDTHMDAWSHHTGEEQMDQSMCREEQCDAVMQKEGGGRQGTLRSGANTEEERGNNKRWDLTHTLLSPHVLLLFSSDHRPKCRISWMTCKKQDSFQIKTSQLANPILSRVGFIPYAAIASIIKEPQTYRHLTCTFKNRILNAAWTAAESIIFKLKWLSMFSGQ